MQVVLRDWGCEDGGEWWETDEEDDVEDDAEPSAGNGAGGRAGVSPKVIQFATKAKTHKHIRPNL